MAENKEEMRNMIERLKRYLERKGLELNMKKTKLMRFRKGNKWEIGKKELEMEGKKDRGGKGVHTFRIRTAEQWESEGTGKG